MPKAEFGIIDAFDEKGNYVQYTPKKYRCVAIDDQYLTDWWEDLQDLDTFNVYSRRVLQAQKALSRWGITIIPPKSLPKLLDIVAADQRYKRDKRLAELARLIRQAIEGNKHMIHYGV